MKILNKPCECEPLAVNRISRSFWMRFVPGARAYACNACGERFLASKRLINAAKIAQRVNTFSHRTTPF